MKNLFKKFITVMLAILILPLPVFASTSSQWLDLKDYDKRQDYLVDKGEVTQYILKMYEYMTWSITPAAKNIFTDVDAATQSYIPKAYALGLVTGTGSATYGTNNPVTKSELSKMIYNTVHKIYPSLNMGGGENLKFTDKVSSIYLPSLQFAASRGIIEPYSTGFIGASDKLTLGEAVKIINTAKRSAPNYDIVLSSLDTLKEKPKSNTSDGTKKAYLTFDDGVSKNTYTILDTLSKYNVKATFFITGKSDASLLKRINDEGHVIGNHTLSHDYSLVYSSPEGFWQDISAEEEYLQSIIGYKPTLIRFPGGSNNTVSQRYNGNDIMKTLTAQSRQRGYTYFDWNVSSGDASGKSISKSQVVSNVLNGSKGKDNVVILMHQTAPKTSTAEALPEIIEGLKNMGYEILPLTTESYCPQFTK